MALPYQRPLILGGVAFDVIRSAVVVVVFVENGIGITAFEIQVARS